MTKLVRSAGLLVAGVLAFSAVGVAAQTVYVVRSVYPQLRDAVVAANAAAAAAAAFDPANIPAMQSANQTRAIYHQSQYTYDAAGYSAYQANGYK